MFKKILIVSLLLAVLFFLVSGSTVASVISKYNTVDDYDKITIDTKTNHTVFCEFACNSTYPNCVETAEVLSQIYTSNEYDFEYITYIPNEHSLALDALEKHYNIAGYPTCFFDGGYEISNNASSSEYNYTKKIEIANNRLIHDLTIDLTVTWFSVDCCRLHVITNVTIRNNEDTAYKGILKVYATEVNSRWNYIFDGNNKSYHNAFIKFIAEDERIDIPSGSSITIKLPPWNAVSPIDLKPSNMMVIAVVSNIENSYVDYSDSPNNKHPFTVYKVDAVSKKKVGNSAEITVPIQIIKPMENKLHNFQRILQGIFLYEKTIINIIIKMFSNLLS